MSIFLAYGFLLATCSVLTWHAVRSEWKSDALVAGAIFFLDIGLLFLAYPMAINWMNMNGF